MEKTNIQIKLEKAPELREYLKNNNVSDVDELINKALESYIKEESNTSKVDKWVKTLDTLVEWAKKDVNNQ